MHARSRKLRSRDRKIEILGGLFVCATIFLAPNFAPAQEPTAVTAEDYQREELGVNRFTAPSIARIFQQLDDLKPLPFEKLQRNFPPASGHARREQVGMIFGGLIADGFLIVSCERKNLVDDLGRVLLREARSLGVAERVMRHSASLTELGKRGDWKAVRQELVATQKDVEQAMIELRDQRMAHLISLGGWLRGLEIAARAVDAQYSPPRAKVLQQTDLADYFAEEMKTLPPPLAATPLFSKLQAGIDSLHNMIHKPNVLSAADVKAICAKTGELNVALGQTE